MANKQLPQLPVLSSLSSGSSLYVVDAGTSFQATVNSFTNFLVTGIGMVVSVPSGGSYRFYAGNLNLYDQGAVDAGADPNNGAVWRPIVSYSGAIILGNLIN